MELLPFAIDGFFPRDAGAAGFQVRLARAPPADPAVLGSIRQARGQLPAPAVSPAAPSISQDEIAALRGELSAVYASTSWRVTALLHALRRLFGR
jgi:hypothetical protein